MTNASNTANTELEQAVQTVETRLQALSQALIKRDSVMIEQLSAQLHQALTQAVEVFAQAAKTGKVPTPLRQRLMRVSAEIAAQRESLARATAALDRAMDVLLPRHQEVVYANTQAGGLTYGAGAYKNQGGSVSA